LGYRGKTKGTHGNFAHKSKFSLYQVHVKNSNGSIVAPFTKKTQANDFVESYKKANPDDNSQFKIKKIIVDEEKLSPSEKEVFVHKTELGSMMKEAKLCRDAGDIVGARLLESMQRQGTKIVQKASDDFLIERNGYRLKFNKGASIKSSVRFFSKADAQSYINIGMVKSLEDGSVAWFKI